MKIKRKKDKKTKNNTPPTKIKEHKYIYRKVQFQLISRNNSHLTQDEESGIILETHYAQFTRYQLLVHVNISKSCP